MLQLTTLGGLSVTLDGAPAGGAAQQRKTLALLAFLAAAGRRGISRDKIVACLWPEADGEHARGLLKQACYALRRDLHAPDLFLGATELRLNPSVITSDVTAFEAALERGGDAEAVGLYAGPFLDGFYLTGSGEFERWAEAERDRLRQLARRALEKLATDATGRGDNRSAAEWWRRLLALDPLNSRVVLGLMNALATLGDRAGALQIARVHEGLLREELNTAPDAAVIRLTNRLRAEPAPLALSLPESGPESSAPNERPVAGEKQEQAGAPPSASSLPAARRGRVARHRSGVGLAVLVGALLTTGWLLLKVPNGARGAATSPEPKKIVVIPFANLGPPEDAYFAAGITEELAARLNAVDRVRIIGSTNAKSYAGKALPEIGKELGVDYVLEGSVRWQKSLPSPARVRVTPRLVSTRDGTQLWAQVYDEPLDEIFRVQSDIAQKVVEALDIALLEPQRQAVDAVPTRNLEAYDSYLRGNDYLRRGGDERNLRAAARLYEKAVDLDPRFALAYSWLSRVYTRIYWRYYDHSKERLEQAKRAADKSLELAPDLPETHNALAIYYGLGLQDYDRAIREYAFAEVRGAGADLFSGRATIRMRQGKIRESLADFEKARQLDPASSTAATNSAHPYNLLRDHPRAEALYDRAIKLAPGQTPPYVQKIWLYLYWDGSTQRARAVLREAEAAGAADGPGVLHARVLMEIFDRRYETALALLSSEAPEIVVADDQRVVPRAQHYAFVYGLMRRPGLARAYYDSAQRLLVRRVQHDPTDPRLRTALGIAYAGLGRKQEAIEEGLKAVELLPIGREAFRGYHHEWELTRIYTMVGEYDIAIRKLEHLLSIPGPLTAAWLRMDPVFDPLRSHPRFQRLVGRKP